MIRTSFHLPRPRHPLARLAWLAIGVVAIASALLLGAIVLAVLVVGGALWMLWRNLRSVLGGQAAMRPSTSPASGVIDGEFTVLPHAPQTPRRN